MWGGVLPHEQTCITYCRQLELPETHRGCALGTFWKSGERAPAGKVREGAVSLRPLLPCVEQCHPVCRHHQRSFLDLLETEWLVVEPAAQKQCRVPRLRQLWHGPLQRRSSFFKRSAFEPWTGFPGLLEQVATDWVSYPTRILSSPALEARSLMSPCLPCGFLPERVRPTLTARLIAGSSRPRSPPGTLAVDAPLPSLPPSVHGLLPVGPKLPLPSLIRTRVTVLRATYVQDDLIPRSLITPAETLFPSHPHRCGLRNGCVYRLGSAMQPSIDPLFLPILLTCSVSQMRG